jgi:hypothetical protein
VAWNCLRGGLEPPDPVAVMGLLAVTFESDVASGATSTSTCTAPYLPPPVPLDYIIFVVFLVTAFGSGVVVADFLASSCTTSGPPPLEQPGAIIDAAPGPPPPEPLSVTAGVASGLPSLGPLGAITDATPGLPLSEPCTCSAVALLGACCPSNAGSVMELLSLRTSLLFFSVEAYGSVDAPVSVDGDREPTLGAGPIITTFSFPLSLTEVAPAPLWPPVASVPGICMPQDMSPSYFIVTSMSSSLGISFSSFDLAACSMKIGMQDGGGVDGVIRDRVGDQL